MIDKLIEEKLVEFLKTQKRNLKRNNLNAVYDEAFKSTIFEPKEITEFFFNHNLDPLDYFIDVIPTGYAMHMNLLSTDLRIKNNITKISGEAFWNCGIEKLYIPSSVKEIGEFAFGQCDQLEEVFIDGCPIFGEDAFIWNPHIKHFRMNCTKKEFERTNPKQYEEYYYDCGLEIEFLK